MPLGLALGALGGWLLVQLELPLAWLIGAILATMAAAFAGVRMAVPMPLRNGMVLVLGLLVGSGFTPDILEHIHRWSVTITGILVYTVLGTIMVTAALRLLFGMRLLDAFFSGLPGGMANVVFVGAELGADLRTLSLVHSTRVVLVCISVPLWFRLVEGVSSVSAARSALGSISLWDLGLFALAGTVGYWLARRLRIPAPYLLGPMFFSAAIHLAGLTTARPPGMLINAAQVVVGSAIGCRFVGVRPGTVLAIAAQGIATTALLLVGSLGFATVLSAVTGLPFSAVLLAFVPGGLPEMTLIALSLDVDVALVVSHHLSRVLFINLAFPVLFRLVPRRYWGLEKA